MLVTRSEEGMTLYTARSDGALHVPAYPVKVRDVSGAGDTVAAVMAVMLAAGADFESATRAANAAAAVVVGKRGTSTASTAELRSPAAAVGVAGGRGEGRSSTGRCSTSGSPNGAGRDCGSASPMDASISCIPATSG